jgi:hypothetical protein
MEQTMTKQVPEAIRGLSRERAPQFNKLMKNVKPPTVIEMGQIWATHSHLHLPDLVESSTDEPRLVVILTGTGNLSTGFEQVTVAPISLMTWAATDYDLVVPETQSTLNYRFMAEVWNETPVLKAHFRKYLGKLSDSAIAAMRSIHIARLVDETLPLNTQAWVGLPLMGENDGRVVFQQAEIEAVEYLANAATAAIFAGVAAPESSPVKQAEQKQRFEVVPKFGNINDFLKAPKRAFAASSAQVGSDMIIANASGDASFTFELLERRRESRVYLVVRDLSPELEGRVSVVTLVMSDSELRSQPSEMHKGAEFQIGKVSVFDRKQVQRVVVEIEEATQ